MRPCIIESPFKGNYQFSEQVHRRYLARAILAVIHKGFTPYASHEMLTRALDDSVMEQREKGLECGAAMSRELIVECQATVFFFEDYHWSSGMNQALNRYDNLLGRYEGIGSDRFLKVRIGQNQSPHPWRSTKVQFGGE